MDISTLKQRAKAFDYLFDAVVVTDLQGVIIDWNAGSERLYGYSKSEAIGQPVDILHVPEDADHITAQVIDAVATHGKWTGEVRMLHKDGHVGWIESMCVPIFDDSENVIGALGINRDITDRVKKIEHLSHLAHFDQLTNIPNRHLLLDRVTHLIEQATRDKKTFALLFIDLDNFKAINDTRGHGFGDVLLAEAAQRLKGAIRQSDTLARFGGDEFVILLENVATRESVGKVAESLIASIDVPFVVRGESIQIGCSIGVASYPTDGVSTDALLAVADKAMYRAKSRPGSDYEF